MDDTPRDCEIFFPPFDYRRSHLIPHRCSVGVKIFYLGRVPGFRGFYVASSRLRERCFPSIAHEPNTWAMLNLGCNSRPAAAPYSWASLSHGEDSYLSRPVPTSTDCSPDHFAVVEITLYL